MEYQFDTETELIFSSLSKFASDKNPVYLVGGIVRDILLNRPIHDIDVAYCGNVREFSKKVADHLGAKFFMLNEKFQTARIIYTSQSNLKRWIDIIAVRENIIERDLLFRDFTVNAIAINLFHRSEIIDPYGGAKDLKNKILRVTNPNSIKDDPVRILRAIRLSVQFGWKMTIDTINEIKENSTLLSCVTKERKRDEIFKILDLPNPAIAIRLLEQVRLLEVCFPYFSKKDEEISYPNENRRNQFIQKIKNLQKFIEFESLIIKREKNKIAMNIFQAELLLNFSEFRLKLTDYFQQTIHQDRNLRSLFIFCILCVSNYENFPDGNISMKRIQDEWVLTKSEINWIHSFWKNIEEIEKITKNHHSLMPMNGHQFFKLSKNTGIALCVYSLLNCLPQEFHLVFDDNGKRQMEAVKYLVDAYFNHYDQWINPSVHINGHDIKRILRIKDGKIIGEILTHLTTKIVNGELKERQDLINYLISNY